MSWPKLFIESAGTEQAPRYRVWRQNAPDTLFRRLSMPVHVGAMELVGTYDSEKEANRVAEACQYRSPPAPVTLFY